MCGNHHGDGRPVDHHHGPVFRPGPRRRVLPRRAFLGDMGRGTIALAIVSPALIAACGDDTDDDAATSTTGNTTSSSTATGPPTSDPGTDDPEDTAGTDDPAEPLRWARTNLGFVSAYVLARGSEAAIVDTGSPGSADAIGATLGDLGLGYADVRHVILTHRHNDHVGSTGAVLDMAAGASAWAGEADLDEIAVDTIAPVTGGEDVFGLEILATPGHTEGHIAVIDHDAGLLVAGDALQTADGGVIGPNPAFTDDPEAANDSVGRLATLTFNTLLVGHGDPLEGGADTAVAALAASLG